MELVSHIPAEYQIYFDVIPQNELQEFKLSFTELSENANQYVQLLDNISIFIEGKSTLSPYWIFIASKLCFTAAKYDLLDKIMETYQDNPSVMIFHARSLTYQNNFAKSEKIGLSVIPKIELFENELLKYSLHFENQFSLGLNCIFSRSFVKLKKLIEEIHNTSSQPNVKLIFGSYLQEMVFYEHILRVSLEFHTGKTREMNDELVSMHSWIDSLQDSWKKGYYYNLLSIAKYQMREMKEGEENSYLALKYFKTVNDSRGIVSVGANLGVSYLIQGLAEKGRNQIIEVLSPMVELKNYSFAITFMLTVAKSYINEKDKLNAVKYLNWAESMSEKAEIIEPASLSLFSYFYSKIGDLDKSTKYLQELEKNIPISNIGKDSYSLIWYYSAASVNAMARGEFGTAEKLISKGIAISEKNANADGIMDSALIKIEILLKKYMSEYHVGNLFEAKQLINDIYPFFNSMENPYYETIFLIITAYIDLVLKDNNSAFKNIDKGEEISRQFQSSIQSQEIVLFNKRFHFLEQIGKKNADIEISDIFNTWFTEEYIQSFYVLESMRLLTSLQFHKANLGNQAIVEDISPTLLLIVSDGGVTILSHKFEGSDFSMDENLIGNFLNAISIFSKEIFGGGQLTRIEQENFILLMEKVSGDNAVVLILEEETYFLRRKFKKLIHELQMSRILVKLTGEVYIDESNPNYSILKSIIEDIFET